MTPQSIGVTGASGFVGTAVSQALQQAGHRVVALGRRPVGAYEHRAYALGADVSTTVLHGLNSVIHCAYDLSLTDSRTIAATNVDGTRALVAAAAETGTRVVLISSMSAYDGTNQIYGRAKLQSEADVLAGGGDTVRLGLVWGGDEGGMIGTLKRLAAAPIVPVFGRGLYQFTVHVDDMAAGLAEMVQRPRFGRPVGLAHPARVPFERIITILAGGRRPRFVVVPWRPTYIALRLAERARLPLPVRADSLLGLVRPAPEVPAVHYWSDVDVSLRAFGEAGPLAGRPALSAT